MHEVLVNRLGGLSLPRKSVVRLTDRPDKTLDVYRGRKTTVQQQQQIPSMGISGCRHYQNVKSFTLYFFYEMGKTRTYGSYPVHGQVMLSCLQLAGVKQRYYLCSVIGRGINFVSKFSDLNVLWFMTRTGEKQQSARMWLNYAFC